MAQKLSFDNINPGVQTNLDYFIPLTLQIVKSERDNFMQNYYPEFRKNVNSKNIQLTNLGQVESLFPETIKQTNDFLAPINVKTEVVTIFGSVGNKTAWNIHCDGTLWEHKPTGLEARLSYYELAEAPGLIRWWENMETEYHFSEFAPISKDKEAIKPLHRFSIRAKVVPDLKTNKVLWDDLPLPDFTTSTDVSSGLLRTNAPHHVIQGPGLRVTIGCQLTFLNGDPRGVWQHIRNNLDKLNLPNVS